jgi:hypothetical protein
MKQNINNIRTICTLLLVALIILTGCKKLLDATPPPGQIIGEEVFDTDSNAVAVMNSVYSFLSQENSFAQGGRSIGYLTAFAADELTPTASPDYLLFYRNVLTAAKFSTNYFWSEMYGRIYTCNKCIEIIPDSKVLSEGLKKQLTGEAKFMRAFIYFQLVNLFGDVPLTTTTDYHVNNALFRAPVRQVYAQIIRDLKEAQAELGTAYVNGFGREVTERVRPNKWGATALLAKVYLYLKDWTNAEAEATKLIAAGSGFDLEADLNDVFLSVSREAIFQLQPAQNKNAMDATMYILSLDPTIYGRIVPTALRSGFASLFRSRDSRLTKWIGQLTVPATATAPSVTYYYPFKYKKTAGPTTEFLMVLRLAEQYLIRAEARAEQNNLSGAKEDLDQIRSRAGLAGVIITTKQTMLDAIAYERQLELFTEWGHRWFDLKRTGTIDAVMAAASIQKGSTWNAYAKLFPIPQTEIQFNPNLVQNPGY